MDLKYLYVPIGEYLHFKLARINLKEIVANVYNSFDHGKISDIFHNRLEDLMNAWFASKSDDDSIKIKVVHSSSLQQSGSVDCGVFVISRMMSLYLEDDADIFNHNDMCHCRDRIMLMMMDYKIDDVIELLS